MITASVSIEIERERRDVFGFVNDTSHTAEWQAGVIAIRGKPGMAVGEVYEVEMQFLGVMQTSRFEVLENDGVGMTRAKSTRGPIHYQTVQRFDAVGPRRTRMTIDVKIDAGTVFRLAEPALLSITQTILGSDLKTLKVVLEAATLRSSA